MVGVVYFENITEASDVESVDAVVHGRCNVKAVEAIRKLAEDNCIENLNLPNCWGLCFSPE